MVAVNAPFGLKAIRHSSGTIRPVRGTIASGASAIFKNSPVTIAADGSVAIATAGGLLVGAFVGCEFTASGRRFVQNFFPNGTVTSDAICFYYDDPEIIYEIQADGTVDQADIGSHADFTSIGTGSTSTGLSTATITATAVTSGTAQVQVIGLSPREGNAWGDAFTVVEVKIAEHQTTGNRANAF